MKVCFIGSYNLVFDSNNTAISSAADQVQPKIKDELSQYYGNNSLFALTSNPHRSWPFGEFYVRSKQCENGKSFGFLNIAIFKTIIFAIRFFIYLLTNEINIIYKYNISFPESLALRMIKLIKKDIFICVIIQDIKYPQSGLKYFHGILASWAIKLCNGFDFIVPITNAIVKDFNMLESKSLVFNGGITKQTEAIINHKMQITRNPSQEIYAVFAGALERYNGIDLLVEEWINSKITIKLHVFGKGNLSNLIVEAACKFDSIIYHGFVPEEEVSKWQILAKYNISLRFSKGINADYFFPSKFFNVVAAPGIVITNKFNHFPDDLKTMCSFVTDDLKNLSALLITKKNENHMLNYQKRLSWLEQNCQWSLVIQECDKQFKKTKLQS